MHEQVARLDVAVHDRVRVRDRQPLAHLHHQVERVLERQVPDPLHVVVERLALEQLHHHVEPAVFFARVVHVDDVAMDHLAGDVGLAIEPLAGLLVALEVGHHHFERDGPTGPLVASAVDHAHRAAADAVGDLVMADALGQAAPGAARRRATSRCRCGHLSDSDVHDQRRDVVARPSLERFAHQSRGRRLDVGHAAQHRRDAIVGHRLVQAVRAEQQPIAGSSDSSRTCTSTWSRAPTTLVSTCRIG